MTTSIYNPLFTQEDCDEYADSIEHTIKFVKVTYQQDNAIWLVKPLQIKGHEMHYTYPLVGQYLPYNVVLDENSKELPHPRPLFAGDRSPRTTMT